MRLRSSFCLLLIACLAGPLSAAPVPFYLPDDTEIVVGLEIGPLVDSPAGQKYIPKLMSRPGKLFPGIGDDEGRKALDGLKKFIGFTDAKQQAVFKETCHRLIMAGPFASGEPGYLWILEGKFDGAKFKELVELAIKNKPLGATVEARKSGDNDFYVLKVPETEPVYLARPDEHHILFSGSQKRVEDGLTHVGGVPSKARADLRELVGKADTKQVVWVAAVLSKDDNLESFSGGCTVERGIKAQLIATAKSADIAQRLAEQLQEKKKDFAALPEPPGKLAVLGLAMLRHFSVTQKGTTLTFVVELKDDQLDALLLAEE
jgi:hypothetical protein